MISSSSSRDLIQVPAHHYSKCHFISVRPIPLDWLLAAFEQPKYGFILIRRIALVTASYSRANRRDLPQTLLDHNRRRSFVLAHLSLRRFSAICLSILFGRTPPNLFSVPSTLPPIFFNCESKGFKATPRTNPIKTNFNRAVKVKCLISVSVWRVFRPFSDPSFVHKTK